MRKRYAFLGIAMLCAAGLLGALAGRYTVHVNGETIRFTVD